MYVLFSVVESKIRKNAVGNGTLLLMQGMQEITLSMDCTYKLDSKIKKLEIDWTRKKHNFSQMRADVFRLFAAASSSHKTFIYQMSCLVYYTDFLIKKSVIRRIVK